MDKNRNPTPNMIIVPTPTDDEAAALFAAIAASCLVEDEAHLDDDTAHSLWQSSRILMHQQVALAHPCRRPSWQSIERLRRAGAGPSGIVGL